MSTIRVDSRCSANTVTFTLIPRQAGQLANMLEQRIIVGFTSGCGEYSATHHHLPATMFAAVPGRQTCRRCTGQIHRRTWLSQRQSPPGRRQHAASFGEIADKVNLPLHRPPIGTRADRHWMKRRNGPPHLRQFGREGLIMFHPKGWSRFGGCRKLDFGRGWTKAQLSRFHIRSNENLA